MYLQVGFWPWPFSGQNKCLMGKQMLADMIKPLFPTRSNYRSFTYSATQLPLRSAETRRTDGSSSTAVFLQGRREGSRMWARRIPVGREATKTRLHSLWIQTDNFRFSQPFFLSLHHQNQMNPNTVIKWPSWKQDLFPLNAQGSTILQYTESAAFAL